MAQPCPKSAFENFLEVLNATENYLIEIAIAPSGTSKFNRAIYFDNLTEFDLQRISKAKGNFSFTTGLSKEGLQPLVFGVETNRKGGDQHTRIKNIISFDLDFKENVEGYKSSQSDEVRIRVGEKIQDALKQHKIPIWMMVFSGNGFHLHFKLSTPYQITSVQKYKQLYECMQSYLECITNLKFDSACSNPSRLMRLPFSTNWKDIENPKPCVIWEHDPEADFSPLFNSFRDTIESKPEVDNRFKSDKKLLLSKLELETILNHFNYEKSSSINTKSGQLICSSPFTQDSEPSFYYDRQKKLFYDFSSGFGGDLLSLIAKLGNLDIKNDFPKVLHLGEKIAGIEPSTEKESGFKIDDKGVWFQSAKEADPQWLSSPIFIDALTRDASSQSWGRLLIFKDQDQITKHWSMPMELLAGDGSEIRRCLLSMGAELNIGKRERQLFLSYLQASRPTKRVQCVNQIGWHQNRFVLPDQVFSHPSADGEIILQSIAKDPSFCSLGTLQDWQDTVAKFCQGNSRLVFAVSTAIASVLLRMTGEESGGFHFVGPSSIGKSITLKVAASVWGNPGLNGFIKRWRSTLNGLELLAASRCDSLLILDELGEVQPKDAGNTAYMLSSGLSKNRATKHTTLASQSEWRLLFLSSGEITLSAHISQSGNQVNAGQEVRMIDIPAQTEGSFGVFENIHGYDSPGAFASALSENTEKNFGSAIKYFLTKITESPEILNSVALKMTEFISGLKNQTHHGQVHRALKRFALVAAAGELAIELGILPWSKGEVKAATEKCFKDWLLAWPHNGSRESQQLTEQIKSILQEFGPSRFPILSDFKNHGTDHHQQLWGFRKETKENGYEWIVLSEVFKNTICKGHEYRRALQDLKEKKILLMAPNGNSSAPMRVPHLGVTRVVRLSGSILEEL